MSDARLPRYQRLRDHIAAQIADGHLPPGGAIPTEAELAARHNLAVGTVRKALDALVSDGLVERHQGRGTFVKRPDFTSSLFRFFRHAGQGNKGAIPGSRIVEREVLPRCPPHVADALKISSQNEVIHLSRLRLSGSRPFLAEDIWLAHDRFAPLLTADEAEIGPLLYPAYERLCGEVVGRAEETLSVGTADGIDMRLPGLVSGEPVVKVDRLAFGFDNRPLEWRRSQGSAASFRYHIEIR